MSEATDSTPGHPDSGIIEPERLAELFHEAYERLAPDFGYETRAESAVRWDDVPEQNKALMIAVCDDIGPLFRTVVHGCCVDVADARSEITTRDAEIERPSAEVAALRDQRSEARRSGHVPPRLFGVRR